MRFTPYAAPRWLKGGHAQTVYPYLFRHLPSPRLRRERWPTADRDFIDVDWLDGPAGAPVVVLFHGLEGGSRSHYARALLRRAQAHGWRAAVPHFRGCSGTPNRLPRAYHSGDFEEIDWILRRFGEVAPDVARFAVGISLGGNALLKWLARSSAEAGQYIVAAASVSAPVDLHAAGHGLARGLNRLYTRHFLRSLKRKSLDKLRRFPGLYDGEAMRRASTLFEFDNVVTAPLHGFRDANDYWTRASSKADLARIELPTLVLHARNDPFLPGAFLPVASAVSAQVTLEITEEGGHVGFVSGAFPGHIDWLPERLLAFFAAALAERPAVPTRGIIDRAVPNPGF